MPPVRPPALTAKIVKWDRERGYGFLQVGKEQLFLHRRDFAGHHRTPVVGDKINFILGLDIKGRTCAKNAVHADCSVGTMVVSTLVSIGLLILPVIAGERRGVDFRWVGAYGIVLSALTYWAYASDKRRAQGGEWRMPEARLHLLELLGGWPGAFLAQRFLRHKCSKGSYQVVFWLIVLGYQFAGFDSLQDWQFSRGAVKRIEAILEHRR